MSKTCPICGTVLPLQTRAIPPKYCSSRCRQKAYRVAHPGCDRKYNRKRQLAHPEYSREYCRQWRVDHLEYERERSRKWQRSHPEWFRANSHKRRQAVRNSSVHHNGSDLIHIYNLAHGCCAYCSKWVPLAGVGCGQFDHVVPISRGGDDGVGNLAWTCAYCNLSKHDKFLVEWRHEKQQDASDKAYE